MSKLVCIYPVPQVEPDYRPWPDAQWWRLRLRPTPGGHLMVMAHNGDEDLSTATWVSWEWFDGHGAVIGSGLDGPVIPAYTHELAGVRYLDILHSGPPTPANWEPIGFPHPQWLESADDVTPPRTRVFTAP